VRERKLCVLLTAFRSDQSKRDFAFKIFSNCKSFFNRQEPIEDQTKFKITQVIKLSTVLSNYAQKKKCDTNEDDNTTFKVEIQVLHSLIQLS